MTSTAEPRPGGAAAAVRPVLTAVPNAVTRLRREPPPEAASLALLSVLTVLATVAGSALSMTYFPPSLLSLPLLVGGMFLTRPRLARLALVVAACLAWDVVDFGVIAVRPGSLAVVLVTGVVAFEFARSREETGLAGLRGDSVLGELRRRLEQQGEPPLLPRAWRVEAVVRPAGGGPFAGDFVVSALTDEERFEVALVDVSGKGVEAGTRSLLLSGALGGLLGSKEPQHFLASANSYLVRQNWEEGFATAVHLVLDLTDGTYAVSSAGHPPVAHFDAGSGRWGQLEAHGAALGLLPDMTYEPATGQLRPGDALLLYTDGLVEVPGRDLSVGIDKLLGEAERLVTQGFAGGGAVLVDRVAPSSSDDRGLVLLWWSR